MIGNVPLTNYHRKEVRPAGDTTLLQLGLNIISCLFLPGLLNNTKLLWCTCTEFMMRTHYVWAHIELQHTADDPLVCFVWVLYVWRLTGNRERWGSWLQRGHLTWKTPTDCLLWSFNWTTNIWTSAVSGVEINSKVLQWCSSDCRKLLTRRLWWRSGALLVSLFSHGGSPCHTESSPKILNDWIQFSVAEKWVWDHHIRLQIKDNAEYDVIFWHEQN